MGKNNSAAIAHPLRAISKINDLFILLCVEPVDIDARKLSAASVVRVPINFFLSGDQLKAMNMPSGSSTGAMGCGVCSSQDLFKSMTYEWLLKR